MVFLNDFEAVKNVLFPDTFLGRPYNGAVKMVLKNLALRMIVDRNGESTGVYS